MNTRFVKVIGNNKIIEKRKNIVVYRTEKIENPETGEVKEVVFQTFNPTDMILFNDGWEICVETPPTKTELTEKLRKDILDNIDSYHSSNELNVFYINETPLWLDKNLRGELKTRFEAELKKGKTTTILWYNNVPFNLSLNNAIQMLCDLEIYASECYDATQRHIANVKKIKTIDELEKYNYRSDYPEILKF